MMESTKQHTVFFCYFYLTHKVPVRKFESDVIVSLDCAQMAECQSGSGCLAVMKSSWGGHYIERKQP